MEDNTLDTFLALEKGDVILPEHIVNLLKDMGYTSFRALAKIYVGQLNILKSFVKTFYTGKTFTEKKLLNCYPNKNKNRSQLWN